MTTVPSQYIGFRLDSSDVELLEQFKLPGESDSLAAKRLLSQLLNTSNTDNSIENSRQQADNIKQQLDDLVKQRFDEIQLNALSLSSKAIEVINQFEDKHEEACKRAFDTAQAFIDHRIDAALSPILGRLAALEADNNQDNAIDNTQQESERLEVVEAIGLETNTDASDNRIDNKQKALELKQQGLTNVAIAKQLGVASSTVGRWLKPKSKVPTSQWERRIDAALEGV